MNDRIYTTLEILCVFCWFLLDGFWLHEWMVATYVFSALAIILAVSMFWYIKRERVVLLIGCADSSWLVTNILWAVGDLSHSKPALLISKILFWIGLAFCAAAFCATEHSKRLSVLALSRLRILKFFTKGAAILAIAFLLQGCASPQGEYMGVMKPAAVWRWCPICERYIRTPISTEHRPEHMM